MHPEEFLSRIQTVLPEGRPGVSKQYPEVVIEPATLLHTAGLLKSDPRLQLDFLICLTAIDRKDGFHLVYHLGSSRHPLVMVLRTVITDKANPVMASVAQVWAAAEFFEREAFDLMGIRFEGHPDLRRIFLEDDWQGFPLRKDYKDSFTLER